jgi:CBS domain-containing protein
MSSSDMGTVLNTSIQSIMDLDVVVLDGNNSVSDAVEKMKEKNSRSVLVTHTGEIIGIVSKTDILFKVMGRGKDSTKAKLREIMSSPVLTIPPSSTVGEALSIMDKNTVRQLVVSFGNSIMGMITRDSIFEQVHKASISQATTALSGAPACVINPRAIALIKDLKEGQIACPYCGSPFGDKEVLSKHIDRIHGGSGVLEGDVRKMFE